MAIRAKLDGHLSVPDSACLYLAKTYNVKLVTDAKPLQDAGKRLQVSLSGLLWVFDTLVATDRLPPPVALEKLHRLNEISPFSVPQNSFESRLKRWKALKSHKSRKWP